MSASLEAPIILCCAEENEVALVTIVDELHREGLAPEVLTGVDIDGALLSSAVDRTPGAALFILCQSDELDRTATRRLSGLFSARRGPGHHLVVVPLAPSRPLASLPPIRAALEELRAASQAAGRGSSAPVPGVKLMRDVVGTTDVSAVRERARPHANAEQLARELHRELVAAEALMTRSAPARPPVDSIPVHTRTYSEPSARSESSTHSLHSTRSSSPRHNVAVEGLAAPELEPGAPLTMMGEEEVARLLSPQQPFSDGFGPAAVLRDENPLSRVPSLLDLVPTELTPTDERRVRRELITDPQAVASDPAHERARPATNRVLLFVAIMGIAALAVMAVLHMSASGPGTAPGAVNRGAPKPADARRGAAGPSLAAPAAAADPDASEEGDTGSETDGPPGGQAVRPKTPPPPSDREALLIDQAVADGRVRALDNLLVWPPSKESVTWSEASRYCRSRRLGSLRRWRLATSSELTRLHRSRMLPAGIFWSQKRNEARDEAQALATATGEFADYLVVESAARPVCLRRR